MLVTVKSYCKGLDFFPACIVIGDIIFDQLGIGDFVHVALSGVHALVKRKCMGRQGLLCRINFSTARFIISKFHGAGNYE